MHRIDVHKTGPLEHVDVALCREWLQHAFQAAGFGDNFFGVIALAQFVVVVQGGEDVLEASIGTSYFFEQQQGATPVEGFVEFVEQRLPYSGPDELYRVVTHDQVRWPHFGRQCVFDDEGDVKIRMCSDLGICFGDHVWLDIDADEASARFAAIMVS